MDILKELPPELSIEILKYLTPIATIKLRLVSKHYYDFLTSEVVCSSLSHQFITPEYNSTKALSSWRLHYENHVSRRLSFSSGRPWMVSQLGGVYDANVTAFCPETQCLVLPANFPDEFFVSLSVQDLKTDPPKCVLPRTRTPDGSQITHVALLPSYVAVVTKLRHGYVWNLETHEGHEFKLPDSPVNSMRGSGNFVAVSLKDWVVVHDVQDRKTSTFRDARSVTREFEGEEIAPMYKSSCMVINAEKRVVWMIAPASSDERWFLVTDSFHLETGEFVHGDLYLFLYHKPVPFNCGNGLWLFLERSGRCGCYPGIHNRDSATMRIVLDQATGSLTVEYFPFEYPVPRPLSHHFFYYVWGPAISADGLGCFIDGPTNCLWMLNREPGEEVVRAMRLDWGIDENPLGLIWFCESLALFYSLGEVYIARFKGIHD